MWQNEKFLSTICSHCWVASCSLWHSVFILFACMRLLISLLAVWIYSFVTEEVTYKCANEYKSQKKKPNTIGSDFTSSNVIKNMMSDLQINHSRGWPRSCYPLLPIIDVLLKSHSFKWTMTSPGAILISIEVGMLSAMWHRAEVGRSEEAGWIKPGNSHVPDICMGRMATQRQTHE